MDPRTVGPLEFFGPWFTEPFDIVDRSVESVISALNRHPIAEDQFAQDYVMPLRRCRERQGRFRVYGENQDTYYCFVYCGEESKPDPPVYFESCLDLILDYGFPASAVIDGDHVLVADRFPDFLWRILAYHICLRMDFGVGLSPNVSGIVFNGDLELGDEYVNPIGRPFPAGFTCFVDHDTICIPDWGAAFLSAKSRESFCSRYSPKVSRRWG